MHTKMISSRQCFLLLLFSLMIVGFLAFGPGLYFEGGSDIYAYHVIRGNFTSTPVPYFSSFGFYTFSSWVVAKLYMLYSAMPWFDFLVFLNLTLAVFLLFLLYYIARPPLMLAILFAIPWMDNVLLPELTKEGFWVAFLCLQVYGACDRRQKILQISMLVLFVYSFMIRAEAAFLALICFYLYSLMIRIGEGWRGLLLMHKRLIPFAFVAMLFSVLLNLNFTVQDRLYRSFRPYQFTLWDFKQDPATIKLANGADSIILMAAQNHFISDLSKINKPFFEKIGLHPKDKTISSFSGYIENPTFLVIKAINGIDASWRYLWPVASLGLIVFFSLIISHSGSKPKAFALAGVFLCSNFLLIFFCIFMKLERHLVLPLIMGCTCFMIYSLPGIYWLRWWQMTLIAVGAGLVACNISDQYDFQKSAADKTTALSLDIRERFSSSLIYIDLYTMVKLHGRLFEKDIFPYEKALSFDNAIISYYPEWKEKMKDFGQPTDISVLPDKWNSISPETIFIFSSGRKDLFEKYFNTVYGKTLTFKEIVSPYSVQAGYPFSYYYILHEK